MVCQDVSWLMVGSFCFLQKKQREFEQKCGGYEQQLKEARQQAEVSCWIMTCWYTISLFHWLTTSSFYHAARKQKGESFGT